MRFTLVISVLIASCLPAMAQLASPHLLTQQGCISVVRGRAHVEEGALGTFIVIENPAFSRAIAGYIPFGDEPTFPELSQIEGRTIEIGGVVVADGRLLIVMTDPKQLAIVG